MSTTCNRCGETVEWGWDKTASRWVPLEPITTHDDLQRTFVDENNVLRADHRDRHKKGDSGVNVTRLEKKVPAAIAKEHGGTIVRAQRKKPGGVRSTNRRGSA